MKRSLLRDSGFMYVYCDISFIFYLMAPKVAPVVEMESHLFPKHNPRH